MVNVTEHNVKLGYFTSSMSLVFEYQFSSATAVVKSVSHDPKLLQKIVKLVMPRNAKYVFSATTSVCCNSCDTLLFPQVKWN